MLISGLKGLSRFSDCECLLREPQLYCITHMNLSCACHICNFLPTMYISLPVKDQLTSAT